MLLPQIRRLEAAVVLVVRAGLVAVGRVVEGQLLVVRVREHLPHVQTALVLLLRLLQGLRRGCFGVRGRLPPQLQLHVLVSDGLQIRLPRLERRDFMQIGCVRRFRLGEQSRRLRRVALRGVPRIQRIPGLHHLLVLLHDGLIRLLRVHGLVMLLFKAEVAQHNG